ncbi:hypothetical protein AX17_007479 [Amanita inopinata Kibby_2008]|nr:hypothetical protein AX17_007479 [Amanita inopinata Kibby_2008]
MYKDIRLLSPRECVRCLQSLTRNPRLPSLVRSLVLDLQGLNSPTQNLYRLLHTALRSLTSLKSLYLDLPKHHSPTWVLGGCTFSLQRFTTSLHCQPPLAAFLDTQRNIHELTLRGFQNEGSAIHPFLNPTADIQPLATDFELKPDSLPLLALFHAVHAGPPIIRTVVTGRPLRLASVPLFPRCTTQTLDALTLTSVPLVKLSLISFDPEAPTFLFAQLVQRFPRLQALHVVLLMTNCDMALLRATAKFLAEFRSLQYITFMASMGDEEDIDDYAIASVWHKACPTLKTIILPRGKVWFDGSTRSGWSRLDG